MENISLGQTGLAGQRRSSKPGAGSGHDEQWQRALEKAYLEKQVAVMRSTGPSDVGSGPVKEVLSGQPQQVSVQPNEPVVGREGQTQDRLLQAAKCETFQVAFAAVGSQEKSAPTVSLRPALALSGQNFMRLPSPDSVGTEAISPSRKVSTSLQYVLPPSSSVRTLVAEQGVHVVIRDATLENAAVLRLLKKIRDVLAEENQRLVAVTLNGERIWENQDLFSGPDDGIDTKPHINRLY